MTTDQPGTVHEVPAVVLACHANGGRSVAPSLLTSTARPGRGRVSQHRAREHVHPGVARYRKML